VRKLATVAVGVAIAAILAVAAVDAFRGSNAARPAENSERSMVDTGTTGPPHCGSEQLALSIEAFDDQSAFVLRHVRGQACRQRSLILRAFIVDQRRRTGELGFFDANDLGGDYPPRLGAHCSSQRLLRRRALRR
jgi:hypothetical protein